MPFTNIFTYIYHQHAKHSLTTFIKTLHIYKNLIIYPCTSTEETEWENNKEPRTAPHEIF